MAPSSMYQLANLSIALAQAGLLNAIRLEARNLPPYTDGFREVLVGAIVCAFQCSLARLSGVEVLAGVGADSDGRGWNALEAALEGDWTTPPPG